MKTPISQWPVPILALWVITATCTFDPHPKSGVQACSPGDGLCPHGYVCAADNMCWLPEDLAADAGGAGTGGGTPNSGGTPGVGGATGGSPAAGGAVATGGTSTRGGSPAAGGAVATGGTSTRGGSPAAGGAVATGGTSTTGGGTCAAPSTSTLTTNGLAWWVTPSGALYCTGDIWCSASHPYSCSQTKLCYSTQEEAAAACGSTCSACVATTCQCSCECETLSGADRTMTTCQPGPANSSTQGNPCVECCGYRCGGLYLMESGIPWVSSCTILP
jgi:hypothetical protein